MPVNKIYEMALKGNPQHKPKRKEREKHHTREVILYLAFQPNSHPEASLGGCARSSPSIPLHLAEKPASDAFQS
jgi:hypothetical protein